MQNIQKLAKMLDGNQMVTTEEFKSAVSDFINAFAQHRSATGEINKKTTETLNTTLKYLQEEFTRIRDEVKKETRTKVALDDTITEQIDSKTEEKRAFLLQEMQTLAEQLREELKGMKPMNGRDGKDGKDGKSIVGQKGKDGSPDTPDEVIDKVNSSKKKINRERVEGLEQAILNSASNAVKSLPSTTTLVNGKRAKNLSFSGATVNVVGDTANVVIAGSGLGDVVGPASATDSNFAAFDTTTGKLIKDSTYNASSFAPALGADDNYVTDAEKIVIGNTSGTNTGDNATNTSSANTALSNLASVAINTALVSDTDNTDDLGTTLKKWANLFVTTIGATATRVTKGWFTDLEVTNLPTVNGGTLATALSLGTMASETATNYVAKSLYDAQTIVHATSDNTPVALTVGEQTLVGRATGGNISAIAIDSDLSSVSANDDTVPSAKATKAMGDLKLPLAGGTMTGNITLGENTGLALDPAGSADGKWSGIIIAGTAGYTQAFGDLVYLAVADSRWELADADAEATGGYVILGMVVSAGTDGTACTILLQGQIRADAKFPALTVGKQVFVGETAGAIQVAIPTGADNVIRSVGFALTADEIYFNPSQDYQLSVA